MPSAKRLASLATRSRLLDSAATAIADLGLDGITARAIADGAGVSASAINYTFGSLEELLAGTFEQLREADRRWWDEILQSVAKHSGSRSFESLLRATVDVDSRERRPASLVRTECRLSALQNPKHTAIAAAWYEDEVRFWATALSHFGLDPSAAALVQETTIAVAQIHYCGSPSIAQVAWVHEALTRFVQRLRREAVTPAGAWRDFLTQPETEGVLRGRAVRSKTEQRIVDGALKVILRSGARGLTHRAVAEAAGVSLSSTTYHFASREDILRAAYGALRFALASRATASISDEKPLLQPEAYSRQMAQLLIEPSGDLSAQALAFPYLLNSGYRDPLLRPAAINAYASLGMTTSDLLLRIQGLGSVDRLDAFLLAAWTSVVLQIAYYAARHERQSWLEYRYRDTLRRLFGI